MSFDEKVTGFIWIFLLKQFLPMHKVQIYGEIVPYQDGWVVDNGFCNLTYVNKQLAEAGGKEVLIGINSFGGDVDEGFAIYSAIRRYAKENNVKITTRADGRCSSIATVIFLAGDTRIGNRYVEPFVHNAWIYQEGDAKSFVRVAAELEKTNKQIALFYSEHTDLTYDEARALMEKDTFITAEEALNIRFATEIEEVLRPVALQKFTNKFNKTMSDKNEKGLIALLRKALNVEGSVKNLEVFTSTNESLVFPDLEEGQSPSVGDKATIDGKAAEGRITIADGTTYVFVAGELTEIIPAEEDDDVEEEIVALKKENEALKAQVETMNSTLQGVVAKQKEADTKWNNLKKTISAYAVDSKDEEDKWKGGEGKGKLNSSISKLKK